MEQYKRHSHLYVLFCAMLACYGTSFYVNRRMKWEIPSAVLFFGIFLMILLLHICYQFRRQPLLYVGLGAAVLIVLFLYVRNRSGGESNSIIFCRLFYILLAGVFSYAASRVYLLRVAAAAATVIAAALLGSLGEMVSRFGAACAATYVIMVVIEASLRHGISEPEKRKHAVETLLPVYMIAAVLLLAVPISEECFQWSIARAIIHKVEESVTSIQDYLRDRDSESYGEYSIGMTGYSEEGHVGGVIFESEDGALMVSSTKPENKAVYLMGNTKNSYGNNRWTNTINEEDYPIKEAEGDMDTLEFLYSLYRYNGFADLKQFIRKRSIRITYQGIRTKSVFRMEKMKGIVYESSNPDRKKSYLEPAFQKMAGDGTTYELEYYALNSGSKEFAAMIGEEQEYRYDKEKANDAETLKSLTRKNENLRDINIPDNLEEELAKRWQFIYDHYTRVDSKILARIRPLASEVAKGASGTYEKLLALENYLKTFRYTTSPEVPKEGEDVVMDFLFRTHEGYCTYFSTAMALMARSLGIPSRYVQGYVIGAQKDKWNDFMVRNKQAHAWVQAYVDGVGWISFEPTAGYDRKETVFYEEEKQRPAAVSPGAMKAKEGLKADAGERGSLQVKWILAAVFLAGTVATLLVLTVYVQTKRIRRQYERADRTRQFYYEVLRMQHLLKRLSYERHGSDTWECFMKRVTEAFPKEEQMLVQVAGGYSKVRYHKERAKEEDLAAVRTANQAFMARLKEKMRRIPYLVLRLRLQMCSVKNMEVQNEKE